MIEAIEAILDQCLDDIRAKRATAADCLKKYPQYADELKPLLETALVLEAAPDVKPSLSFKLRTRARLVQLSHPAPAPRFAFLIPRFSLATAAAIVLLAIGLTGGIVYAANESLPGSALYPIKLNMEGLQVLLATDPESQARVHMTLAERRLEEAKVVSNSPEQSALAVQTIAEYNNQVNAAIVATQSVPASNAAPLTQEFKNRLTDQQNELRALEKKVAASTLEKALNVSGNAIEKLNTLTPPASAPIVPATRVPASPTDTILPSGTPPARPITPTISLPILVPSAIVPAISPTLLVPPTEVLPLPKSTPQPPGLTAVPPVVNPPGPPAPPGPPLPPIPPVPHVP